MRAGLHVILHILVPGLVARFGYSANRLHAFLWMMGGMIIDVDHFFATPMYDPDRCSVGFHPLHTVWVMPIYIGLCIPKKTRPLGIGLCIHIVLDLFDCAWMTWF